MLRSRLITVGAAVVVLFSLVAGQCNAPPATQDQSNQDDQQATGEEGPPDLLAEQGWDLKADVGWTHDVGFSFLCWFLNTDPAPGAPYEIRANGPAVAETPQQAGSLDAKGEAAGKFKITAFGKYTVTAKVTYEGNEQAATAAADVVEGPGPKSC